MFYFLLAPILTYNWILIVAAVVPAVFLMVKVYHSDHLDQESPELIGKLVIAGILSTLLAMVEERIGSTVLLMFFSEATRAYNLLLYFVVVGLAEESSKYILMKRRTWSSPEFNCQYDGVVYAVFASLGFALWENISYVLHYGFSTAIVRAVTAIPGHACFGVFMGVFYGLARSYAFLGEQEKSKQFRVLAVLVPTLLHGAYDYIASSQESGALTFILFIAVLFTLAFSLVSRMSKNDRYFRMDRRNIHF